jgi:beta-D-xylosidase 4
MFVSRFKDSRWGRGQETPGEDPYHLSSYVKSLIEGLQGNGKYKRVVATCKHFVAYDLETWNGNFRYVLQAKTYTNTLRQATDNPLGINLILISAPR